MPSNGTVSRLDVFPGLTRDIAVQSIYTLIEQTLHLQIAYAQRIIEAVRRGIPIQRSPGAVTQPTLPAL